MHTCIPSHELKKSWHSCPRRVNASNKKKTTQHAPSTKMECVYLYGWIKKWIHTQKSHQEWWNPEIKLGMQKKKSPVWLDQGKQGGEPPSHCSWGRTITTRLSIQFSIAKCLDSLVVKAPASRAEDPRFESCLRQDFSRVKSYQWLKNWHSSDYPARCLVL